LALRQLPKRYLKKVKECKRRRRRRKKKKKRRRYGYIKSYIS